MDYIVNNAFNTDSDKAAVALFETDANKVRIRIRVEGEIDLYQVEEMFYEQTFDSQLNKKILSSVINRIELCLKNLGM